MASSNASKLKKFARFLYYLLFFLHQCFIGNTANAHGAMAAQRVETRPTPDG
jgi:hypothetical protein